MHGQESHRQTIDTLLLWVSQAEEKIQTAICESAIGTGYEDALKRQIYGRLGTIFCPEQRCFRRKLLFDRQKMPWVPAAHPDLHEAPQALIEFQVVGSVRSVNKNTASREARLAVPAAKARFS